MYSRLSLVSVMFLSRSAVLLYLALVLMGGSCATAEEVVFAHGANPGNPRYEAAEMFSELVSGCSNLIVNNAPSATMGNDGEVLIAAQAGIIEMSANSQGSLAQIIPEVGMLGLPFLFKNELSVWQVLDGVIGRRLDEKAQKVGLKIITFWDNGFRNVTHVSKFIVAPEDAQGMNIRTPPDTVTIDIFDALGATPAPLAWSELPTALSSGTFDGQENPLTNIYSAKLHEITPYVSMTGHKYESTPVVAGLDWWETLTFDDRACVERSARQAGWYQRGRNMLANKSLRALMEVEGAQFNEVDTEAFVKATNVVYLKYVEKLGGFVSDLRSEAELANRNESK